MKFTLLSLVAGNSVCNARCPFCVSRMTPAHGVSKQKPVTDWRNFRKAVRLASDGGVNTVMITGKGEPALFPEQITEYLAALQEFDFQFIELQTNGLLFLEKKDEYSAYLDRWYDLGLTTIAISVTHFDDERNRSIYLPHRKKYPSLAELINLLHAKHFTVRLACVMCRGYIDNAQSFEELVEFARKHGVEQLSARPVNAPAESADKEASDWVEEHRLTDEQLAEIGAFVEENGKLLMQLPHGAQVYDVHGQNVCVTNCLTVQPETEQVRQLIFFPNGNVTYDWQYEGAKFLRGRYV